MKILVPVKKVIDYNEKLKLNSSANAVETNGVKWIMNPFDAIAVEEAIRLKDAGKATEVVVVSIGDEECVTHLRYAMAMGADSAIHLKTSQTVDSDLAARALAEIVKRGFNLVVLGKQAIDSDAGQTAQLLGAYLGYSVASFASKVEVDGGAAVITREVDGGLEKLKINLPAIVSTDLRLNEPRYAPLPGIMKAKKKPLEEISLETLGLDLSLKVEVKKVYLPEARKAGKKVASVDELIKELKETAQVL